MITGSSFSLTSVSLYSLQFTLTEKRHGIGERGLNKKPLVCTWPYAGHFPRYTDEDTGKHRGDTTCLMSAEAFGSQFSASSTTPQMILSLVHCVALAKSRPLSGLHCTDAKPIRLGSPRSLLRMLVQE